MPLQSPVDSTEGLTSEEVNQLMEDLQEDDIRSEESELIVPNHHHPAEDGDGNLLSIVQPSPLSKPLVKERENYLPVPPNDNEDEGKAGEMPWIDLDETANSEASTDSDEESQTDFVPRSESVTSSSAKSEVSQTMSPRLSKKKTANYKRQANRKKKAYPAVPVRASKRIRSMKNADGEEKWLEDRAVTHFVLSPYDDFLDLLSLVE